MKDSSVRHFEAFYPPLVGNEDAIGELQDRLAWSVHRNPGSPYVGLFEGFATEQKAVLQHISGQHPGEDDQTAIGTSLTVATLETVGNIYARRAEVAQTAESVAANVNRASRFAFRLAFTGKVVGNLNLAVLRRGLNPRNPLNAPILCGQILADALLPIKVHRRVFTTSVVEAGQLDLQLRPLLVGKVRDRQCPAVFAKAEHGGRMRSALLTYMQTIGTVAMQDIYPEMFEIEEAR